MSHAQYTWSSLLCEFDLLHQIYPFRRKGDVDSLYASCQVDIMENVAVSWSFQPIRMKFLMSLYLFYVWCLTVTNFPSVKTLLIVPQVAETVLGWKSRRSLGEMCRDMWNWQTKNPQGFSGKQWPQKNLNEKLKDHVWQHILDVDQ